MSEIKFLNHSESFVVKNPENYSGLYFPIAGENGLKSCVTPNMGGDSKLDQNHFLLEPVSIENLHNNRSTRNFWIQIAGEGVWSACGNSAEQELHKFDEQKEESVLEAGFMWQKMTRTSEKYQLQSEITMFVPTDGENEVMLVAITNLAKEARKITPIAAVPIYGRSADNLRDHRHVTSLLHRIRTTDRGVVTTPVLSFDERGHQKNSVSYYVCGSEGDGKKPTKFYPTVESFIGEGGTFLNPQAVREDLEGVIAGTCVDGKEAMGGIRFASTTLQSKETKYYVVLIGVAEQEEEMEKQIERFSTQEQVISELETLKIYWKEKVNVSFQMENEETDIFLKWICFQPILRRIYGCSFLPYHDYGKGGRGWRDLWQDCLALLLMEPSQVRQMIVDNYGGVRIDGTNATIIGNKQGEFIADRNNIARVWMDHAFWPFVTTKLYMDQTGDLEVLLEDIPYFKDKQSQRGTAHDECWKEEDGNHQKTIEQEVYYGSMLEHIILQNLCAFYDVGEHNEILLHGADWNDALDMAPERGESVAFTCAYAGNLADIAEYLGKLMQITGKEELELAEEMSILLENDFCNYDSISEKRNVLRTYACKVEHTVSGQKKTYKIADVKRNLEEKSTWLMEHIRKNEWIADGKEQGWFNGYYDNHGNRVEGVVNTVTRMMLTSQVFAIMSKTATEKQIEGICKCADKYLYEASAGGYRLNTDFKEEKFDLGRMFGFAFGTKENGAVFSHMTVMYANALYQRGFVKEGYKALQTLLESAMRFEQSKMYPGVPEYFDNDGRGLYPYLTGAASWYMLTMVTEVFGVYGSMGNLVFEPKLMKAQFDADKTAAIRLIMNEKKLCVRYHNPNAKEYGEYKIEKALCNGKEINLPDSYKAQLAKEELVKMNPEEEQQIEIYLN